MVCATCFCIKQLGNEKAPPQYIGSQEKGIFTANLFYKNASLIIRINHFPVHQLILHTSIENGALQKIET